MVYGTHLGRRRYPERIGLFGGNRRTRGGLRKNRKVPPPTLHYVEPSVDPNVSHHSNRRKGSELVQFRYPFQCVTLLRPGPKLGRLYKTDTIRRRGLYSRRYYDRGPTLVREKVGTEEIGTPVSLNINLESE